MKIKVAYIAAVFVLYCNTTSAQLVYQDVAPIFISKCTPCHHINNIFPSFTTYNSVFGYRALIDANLQSGKMPPWSPDTLYSRFAHERAITQTEKTKIQNWIAAGALPGDTTLVAIAPQYSSTLLNGTPDLILTIPTYTSNATSMDKYVCFSMPTGLTQNRILRAYEVIPGNAPIVHHAVIGVDTIGNTTNDLSGSCYNIPGNFSLGAYAPGAPPTIFPGVAPAKFGITIKAGSKIILQMHYPKGSAGQVDFTQIRLFFYPIGETNVRPMYVGTPLQNWTFFIPANTTKTVTASYPSAPLPTDISVYSIFPHSHKICKSIENYANNGTSTIPLCRINKWDFEWQGFYTFRNFLKIPTGYKLYGKHVFDNTTANPNNPNPAVVYAGLNTSDEMLFDGLMWANYLPGDENIDVAAMLAADPLFTIPTSISKKNAEKTIISAFPNPFNDNIKISYTVFSTQYVSISIHNSLGQKISILSSKIEIPGNYSCEWDGKNIEGAQVASGIYNYKVTIGKQDHTGKIVFNSKN